MQRRRIQGAIKRPGAFSKYCGGNVTDECIKKGKSCNDPKVRKMAILAMTLKKLRSKK